MPISLSTKKSTSDAAISFGKSVTRKNMRADIEEAEIICKLKSYQAGDFLKHLKASDTTLACLARRKLAMNFEEAAQQLQLPSPTYYYYVCFIERKARRNNGPIEGIIMLLLFVMDLNNKGLVEVGKRSCRERAMEELASDPAVGLHTSSRVMARSSDAAIRSMLEQTRCYEFILQGQNKLQPWFARLTKQYNSSVERVELKYGTITSANLRLEGKLASSTTSEPEASITTMIHQTLRPDLSLGLDTGHFSSTQQQFLPSTTHGTHSQTPAQPQLEVYNQLGNIAIDTPLGPRPMSKGIPQPVVPLTDPSDNHVFLDPYNYGPVLFNTFSDRPLLFNPFGDRPTLFGSFGENPVILNPSSDNHVVLNPFGDNHAVLNPSGDNHVSFNPFDDNYVVLNPFVDNLVSSEPYGDGAGAWAEPMADSSTTIPQTFQVFNSGACEGFNLDDNTTWDLRLVA